MEKAINNLAVKPDIMLVDASKLGKKVKDGKNQKTVLNEEEVKNLKDLIQTLI